MTFKHAQRATAMLLVVSLLSSSANAAQYCYNDNFGNLICQNRLSTGERIGIGIAILVLGLAIIMAFAYARRRRLQRMNASYINNHQQSQYPQQGGGQGYGQAPPGYPPPQTYSNSYSPYKPHHDGSSPNMPPPVYPGYGPPDGPPPTFDKSKGPYNV